MALVPLKGFLPDVEPTTPGVIVSATNLVPTPKGMAGAPSGVTLGYAALAAECRGLAVCQLLNGSFRNFAATQTTIQEGSGGTWTDVSAGGGYVGSAEGRRRFGQFGNVTISVNKDDNTQKSVTSGAFSALAGAPKAKFVAVASNFVMLADTNDGVDDLTDQWWCCALGDYTDWTPAVATQSAKGRLYDVPGPFRGMKALGNDILIYKEKGIWLGRYVGPPTIWSWQLISNNIGCAAHEAVVDIGVAHLIMGQDDFYLCNGSTPVPIGEGVKTWFFGSEVNNKYLYKVQGMHDIAKDRVFWFYPSASSTSLDKAIIYDYKRGKWGSMTLSVEAVAEFLSGQVTYANIGDYFASYAAIGVTYDSLFWAENAPLLTYADTAHTLKSLTGPSSSSSMTLWHAGDDWAYTLLTGTRLRYVEDPTTASGTNAYQANSGGAWTTDATISASDGKFDFLRSARWHRAAYSFTGDVEISGADYRLDKEGEG